MKDKAPSQPFTPLLERGTYLFDLGGALLYAVVCIPALLILLVIQWVTGKKPSRALEEKVQGIVFFVFLLAIVVVGVVLSSK